MGFFNKLFWGSSKKFANDVTNNVSKAKEQKIKNKVETFNTVSQDFYDRKNFIDDCTTLMVDVVNCFTEEESNTEQEKVLIKEMSDYYQKEKRKIEENGTVPVPQSIESDYSDMLQQYNQVLTYIEKFINQRQWARSTELEEYYQQTRELSVKQMYNEITEEEYSQALKSLTSPPNPLEGTGESISDVIQKLNEYNQALTHTGESILNKLG